MNISVLHIVFPRRSPTGKAESFAGGKYCPRCDERGIFCVAAEYPLECLTMKVDPNSPLYSQGVRAKRRKSETGAVSGFSGMLDGEEGEDAAPVDAASRIAAPPMVGGILSIQEVDESQTRKGRMIRRAHGMLDALEDLKLSLLLGEVPPERLESVRERMREQKEQVADPRLREVMNEIEIRAAVELAKFGM